VSTNTLSNLPSDPLIQEVQYAGFWVRLGAILADTFIVIVVNFLILLPSMISVQAQILSQVLGFGLYFLLNVYCVVKYGGSPGKLIMNLRIRGDVSSDNPRYIVDWRTALLRESVNIFIAVTMLVLNVIAAIAAFDQIKSQGLSQFDSILAMSKATKMTFPAVVGLFTFFSTAWVWSEMIVILTNRKKKSLHDYIAETVVIKL
jgi:uncharacterized RDD family membrane protein YckC